jgi:hypothetical protein
MNQYVDAVILTKSMKNGGYCVAGINVNTSEWVRFISGDTNSHGALSDQDMLYENGKSCDILDVVRVPIIRKAPSIHQPENILIDETKYWKKLHGLSIKDILEIHPAEVHIDLLGNKYPYITEERIHTVNHSLILIKASDLIITHPRTHSTKAKFIYRYDVYENMSVTDPDYYESPEQTYIDKAVLVMSLPDTPYQERRYYKFIAKIFPI